MKREDISTRQFITLKEKIIFIFKRNPIFQTNRIIRCIDINLNLFRIGDNKNNIHLTFI